MKKAKIMLTAIAVLAVVGGTLAFKASTFNSTHLYTCTDVGGGVSSCVLSSPDFITIGQDKFVGATIDNNIGQVPCTNVCDFTVFTKPGN